MTKQCVFTRNKNDLPTLVELRTAAINNPGIPVIIKTKDTNETFIYLDGIYSLVEVPTEEIVDLPNKDIIEEETHE